jgi:hypothetical protein
LLYAALPCIKKCKIIYIHRLCYMLYTQKNSSQYMTPYDLCKKEKTYINSIMCYSHIICLFCTGQKSSYFWIKLCRCTMSSQFNKHKLQLFQPSEIVLIAARSQTKCRKWLIIGAS